MVEVRRARRRRSIPGRGKAEIVTGAGADVPHGIRSGRAGGAIYRSLFALRRDDGGRLCLPRQRRIHREPPGEEVFSPDAAFYRGRLTGGKFWMVPRFRAEVRSEDDYGPVAERRMAAKRADYFAAGTRVVWDVDVLRDEVVSRTSRSGPRNRAFFRRGEVADAEPALPVGRCPSTTSSGATPGAEALPWFLPSVDAPGPRPAWARRLPKQCRAA